MLLFALNESVLYSLQVYVKTFGEHVGFRIFMDSILLSLTRKVSQEKSL